MSSKVYFLPPDRKTDVVKALDAAGIKDVVKKDDFVAVKVHFGEKGNLGHVKAKEIKPVVAQLKNIGAIPFLTDANTIYKGERADAARHLMIASVHDFHPKFMGAPVVIADGLRGNMFVEVDIGQRHFKKVKVAEAIYHADSFVVISHFKGHELCGIGGAIKNLGMGCASRQGKYEQHNSVVPNVDGEKCISCGACVKWCAQNALSLQKDVKAPVTLDAKKCVGCGQCILACPVKAITVPWSDSSEVVQEKIAEYALGVARGRPAIYINYITHITDYCDCFKSMRKPIMPDVGIVVSTDPVAIDMASYDLITKSAGRDIMRESTEVNGRVQIEHAAKLGLGTLSYELIEI